MKHNYTLEWFPGPTQEAKEKQMAQAHLLDTYYEACNYGTETDKETALAAYDQSVNELVTLLGPQAHCNAVDAMLWSEFSDFYKSENGFRPRFHETREGVNFLIFTSQRTDSVPIP